MAFYAVLARKGFFAIEELSRFLRPDGILGGHPDRTQVPGVEVSTGSLGHGLPLAVGVAYALRAKGLDEPRVVVLTGDAELNEGSNWEAILHAGAERARQPDPRGGRQRERHAAHGLDRRQAGGLRLGRGHGRRPRPRGAAQRAPASQRAADGGRRHDRRGRVDGPRADAPGRRGGRGRALRRRPSVAIVLAEISTDLFEPAFRHDPRRAINVGIMEQTMVGVAAGFALEGFRPVVHTIAPFLAERALEQIKLDFGYQRLGGLFVSTGASYDYGTSGMTHHGPGDVAALSTVPGLEIVVPGHRAEAAELVRTTYANGRPTYLRTSAAENPHRRELASAG